MSSVTQGIIIGAAAAAIGTIIATKFINLSPIGGGSEQEPQLHSYTARHGGIRPRTPRINPSGFAPIAQNTPITEAAYNQYPTPYDATLGPDQNQPSNDLVLPV